MTQIIVKEKSFTSIVSDETKRSTIVQDKDAIHISFDNVKGE